jgi:hypothetical protein
MKSRAEGRINGEDPAHNGQPTTSAVQQVRMTPSHWHRLEDRLPLWMTIA